MITLLLIAILITLLFGSAWIGGLFRGIGLLGALFVAGLLLKKVGISLEFAFYAATGLLLMFGIVDWGLKRDRNAKKTAQIRARRELARTERYNAEQEAKAAE